MRIMKINSKTTRKVTQFSVFKFHCKYNTKLYTLHIMVSLKNYLKTQINVII